VNADGDIHSSTADDPAAMSGDLALFELQKPMVEPFLRMFRLTNTALDVLFYDVGAFAAAMFKHGAQIDTGTNSFIPFSLPMAALVGDSMSVRAAAN
jgi:hypothetical protein